LIEALVGRGVAHRRALVEVVHGERTPDFVSSPIFMTSPARGNASSRPPVLRATRQ
jgi:hypothetical protein